MWDDYLENIPIGDELKWLLKRGVGVFLRVVIVFSKICPPYTQII